MKEDHPKVLIIDDCQEDFLILKRFLKDDYSLVYDNGEKDSLNAVAEEKPDCVILDYHIGIKEGIDVLKELKSNQTFNTIPVIMLTNEKNPQTIVQCMKEGCDDYLVKDQIDRERVHSTIKITLEKAQLKRRVKQLESLLPICAHCKKMRVHGADAAKQDSWIPVEQYFHERTGSQFSHGLCPACIDIFYGSGSTDESD